MTTELSNKMNFKNIRPQSINLKIFVGTEEDKIITIDELSTGNIGKTILKQSKHFSISMKQLC